MKRVLPSLALVTAAIYASVAPGKRDQRKYRSWRRSPANSGAASSQELMKRIVNAVEAFGSVGRVDDLGVMVTACKQIVSSANYGARVCRCLYGPW